MTRWTRVLACALLSVAAAACGDDSMLEPDSGPPPRIDNDGDGFTHEEGDCNDNNPNIRPGAPDPCDGVDQNCDGKIDEMYDLDQDGVTVCQGDCADNHANTFPGARELVDGLDNDCDGIADNHTEQYDDDGDGWTEDQGDCDDDEKFVNPGAVEVQFKMDGTAEGVDNNCNGAIDEPMDPCDTGLDQNDAVSYARAIELCQHVLSASFEAPTDERAREIRTRYGTTYAPRAGQNFIVLASGIVADMMDPDYVAPQSGTNLGDDNVHAHPWPTAPTGCGMPDPPQVNDYAEVRFEMLVPTNAQSFSFDFNFMSTEYPEWVCTTFDDTFIAYLESEMFTGNISFDAMGNPVSINVAFFNVCTPPPASCTGSAELAGTGYQQDGGGTGWLTTTAPVKPGEKVTLRFIIFDEGDHILDSAVIIDNFRWHLEAIDKPVTEG